jgi:hypothetical protein
MQLSVRNGLHELNCDHSHSLIQVIPRKKLAVLGFMYLVQLLDHAHRTLTVRTAITLHAFHSFTLPSLEILHKNLPTTTDHL